MIVLHPLFNPLDIIELLVKDEIYKDCFKSDDIYREHIDFKHHLWFQVIKDHKSIGIIWLTDFTHNCVTFHGGLFKEFRGPNTSDILKECLRQLQEANTKIKYFSLALSTNKKAINLLEKIGFTPVMTIVNGADNGDIIIYGNNEVIRHA